MLFDVVVPARNEAPTVGDVVRAARAAAAALPSYLSMSRELLGCLRTVPLWTYGAYLRHLRVLPPG